MSLYSHHRPAGYVSVSVCLSVCKNLKKLQTDFDEIMEGRSLPRENQLDFGGVLDPLPLCCPNFSPP